MDHLKKLIVITEGGVAQGFGHIIRCLAFSEIFKLNGLEIEFLINTQNEKEVRNLVPHSVKTIGDSFQKHVIEYAFKSGDVVLIDSYHLPESFYLQMSRKDLTCLYLDDYNRINYPDGVLINTSPGAKYLNYQQSAQKNYLLGPRYQPLRPEFLNKYDRKTKAQINEVLVTFGGSDDKNMSPVILDALANHSFNINVVIGYAFENIDEIKPYANSKIKLYMSPNAIKMRDLMDQCDLAISAGGQTLFELAKMGLPTVAVMVADNQKLNVKGFMDDGFLKHEIHYESGVIKEEVIQAVDSLNSFESRETISKVGQELLQYNGPEELFKSITSICLDK